MSKPCLLLLSVLNLIFLSGFHPLRGEDVPTLEVRDFLDKDLAQCRRLPGDLRDDGENCGHLMEDHILIGDPGWVVISLYKTQLLPDNTPDAFGSVIRGFRWRETPHIRNRLVAVTRDTGLMRLLTVSRGKSSVEYEIASIFAKNDEDLVIAVRPHSQAKQARFQQPAIESPERDVTFWKWSLKSNEVRRIIDIPCWRFWLAIDSETCAFEKTQPTSNIFRLINRHSGSFTDLTIDPEFEKSDSGFEVGSSQFFSSTAEPTSVIVSGNRKPSAELIVCYDTESGGSVHWQITKKEVVELLHQSDTPSEFRPSRGAQRPSTIMSAYVDVNARHFILLIDTRTGKITQQIPLELDYILWKFPMASPDGRWLAMIGPFHDPNFKDPGLVPDRLLLLDLQSGKRVMDTRINGYRTGTQHIVAVTNNATIVLATNKEIWTEEPTNQWAKKILLSLPPSATDEEAVKPMND